MKVIRRLNLSEDEINVLVSAGKLLGSIRDSKKNEDFDEYSEEDKTLLNGLSNVISECLNWDKDEERA